jgi:superfamily II RNA helicase
MAWQVPLLALTKTRFLLMSATLGDTTRIQEDLEANTGIPVKLVQSVTRPVPLDFSYNLEPLHETIPQLVSENKAPIYIVSFTQSGCASIAQSLTSLNLCDKEEKEKIASEIKGTRLDSPYGTDVKRFLMAGIGLHHAGLLPKYRLLIERLAQAGVLKVIVGTDTLGVGINVPIRTVVFHALSKFDGRKQRLLTVRDFKQIAGRAGRKGFDDQGYVICQAPEHVIENQAIKRKKEANPQKAKRMRLKSAPEGSVTWDENKFQGLIERPSETLTPRFEVSFALLINLLQSPYRAEQRGGGYRALVEIIRRTPTQKRDQRELLREAKRLFQALLKAGVIERVEGARPAQMRVSEDLQADFSMHHSLSLYLLYALGMIPHDVERYELKIVSYVEAILEDPTLVLKRQENEARGAAIAEMKAEGIEYEERMELIKEVTYPKPEQAMIEETFTAYASSRPWVLATPVSPKAVVRDMYERCATFKDYVQQYDLKASEGVLLRYLNSAYKALLQNVPDALKTDGVHDVIAYLRATIRRADSSLMEAWMNMRFGERAVERFNDRLEAESQAVTIERQDLTEDPKAFAARVRAQLRQVVQSLARQNYDEAAEALRPVDEHTQNYPTWDGPSLKAAFKPFYEEYEELLFNREARANHNTLITPLGSRLWRVRQVLLDDQEERSWALEGVIDLRDQETPEGDLFTLVRVDDGSIVSEVEEAQEEAQEER